MYNNLSYRRRLSNLFILIFFLLAQTSFILLVINENSEKKPVPKSSFIDKNNQIENHLNKEEIEYFSPDRNSSFLNSNKKTSRFKVQAKDYSLPIKISGIPRRTLKDKYLLSGLVLDKYLKLPISQATLKLIGQNDNWTIRTDSKGYFYFNNRDLSSSVQIKIKIKNYKYFTKQIDLSLINKENFYVLELSPQVYTLQPVTVFANKHSSKLNKHDVHFGISERIKYSQIARNPSGLNDLFRSFSTLPSVTTINDFGSLLYVRGGSPEQNLFLLDGFKFPYPYRLRLLMGGGISAFIPELIKEAEIIPGGFSAQYGNKLSSVIKVNTVENFSEKLLKLRLDFLTVQTIFSYPLNNGKTNFLFAGRRSIFDTYAGGLLKGNIVIPKFYDFYSKFSHQISPIHKLKICFLHAKEGINYSTFSQEDMNVENKSQNTILGLNLTSVFNRKFSSNISFSVYSDKNKLGFSDLNSSFDANLFFDLKQIDLSGNLRYQFHPDILFEVGSNLNFAQSLIRWNSNWRTKLRFPIQIDYKSKVFIYSNYMQTNFSVFNPIRFTFGLRQDYYSSSQQLILSPRVNFNIRLNETTNLFGAIGNYYQPPDLISMLTRSESIDLTNNFSALKAEKSSHFLLSFKKRWNNSISLKITGFYKQYSNLILPIHPTSYLGKNIGEAVARGIELSIKKKPSAKLPVSTSISYSRSVAKYRHPDFSNWILFNWDHSNTFNSLFEFKPLHNVNIGINWTYRSGFPYSPLQNYSDPLQLLSFRNTKRYPSFSRFDAKINYTIKIGNLLSYSLYMDLLNFTNHKNLYAQNWGIARSTSQGNNQSKPIYMMPFILSIGITIDF